MGMYIDVTHDKLWVSLVLAKKMMDQRWIKINQICRENNNDNGYNNLKKDIDWLEKLIY